MLNLRYLLRLITAVFVRFKALILISIGLGVLIFFGIRVLLPFIAGPPAQKIGIPGRFTPVTLPQSILRQVGNGLTRLDSSGNVEPDLATSWETPDSGKTWIFTIKDGVNWQDGKKVTSQTINYQFSDVTVERPDSNTLIFKLQDAYSAFPAVVSRPTFKSGLLGTGEWEVKKMVLAGSYIDQLTVQRKTGEKIIYKFYPTEERAVLGFQLGAIDVLTDIINPSPLNSWRKVKSITTVNTGEYAAVFFNTQDSVLSDKNIRQALSYGINKDELSEDRAISPISVDSWAYNSQVKPYNYDKEKAKTIIDDYKESAKLDELSINLTTSALLLPQAEKISRDWQEIGVKVNLQVTSNIPTDYQALLAIFDAPDDPDQYTIWHSTQSATNITKYQNPRIDKLLEDGRSEINTEDRKKIYLDFQRFLVEDSPAIFLYYPSTYTISRR
jgi:peptide/nickel transport system substrate-binding protein